MRLQDLMEMEMPLRVVKTDEHDQTDMDDHDDVHYVEFDVYYGDDKIGNMTSDDYYGHVAGTLGARGVTLDMKHSEDFAEEEVKDRLTRYFSTGRGAQHLELIRRKLGA